MQITCYNDGNVFKVSGPAIAAAKLRFALGFNETDFICPKCRKPNAVSEAEFKAAMAGESASKTSTPVPAAGVGRPGIPGVGIAGRAGQAKRIPGFGPAIPNRERHGVVTTRSLHVRKDHSTKSETMAGLRKGDKVTILGTWTDGENTWAQLGPDRWAAIIYKDEPLIEVTD
jgi:hypothetical protein